jgi:uncharacterized membrane protein YbhN (UPF0104 family)
MSMLAANLICVALVALDLAARSWRIQWILRGMHCRLSFRDSVVLNCVGDAGASATPNRIGVEPARFGAAVLAGVPASAGVVAIALETLVMWPVNLAVAGWLAFKFAPAWWHTAGPALEDTADEAWPWLFALVAVGVGAWWAVRKYAPALSHSMRRGTKRAWVYARRMPPWPLLMGAVMSFVSLAARVAILPVLTLTLSHPPPVGPLAFASFALLYSQLLLPTPAGAGIVDIGFLGGAIGIIGGGDKRLLILWRFYTTIILVLLGIGLGVWRFGPAAVKAIARGRDAAADLPAKGA